MARDTNYEYVNKGSIDSELICSICYYPFSDPLSTPCGHIFCRKCITDSINAGNIECPRCRQRLVSVNNRAPASRIVWNMSDHLLARCLFCGKTGLQRGNFNDHVSNGCSEVPVPCPSADINCPWEGPRDQIDTHVRTCVFQSFRSILTDLITKNHNLKSK